MTSRRGYLHTLSASAVVFHPFFSAETTASTASRIFIGADGSGAGHGIFTAEWHSAAGEIGPISLAAEVENPTYLAQYRQGRETLIYAVTEADGDKAKVRAFTTVTGTATLELVYQQATLGDGPTHVSVSPDGGSVFVSNYGWKCEFLPCTRGRRTFRGGVALSVHREWS
jgi:6-phosphogluconolactonase (cycloisomerase 2 family)